MKDHSKQPVSRVSIYLANWCDGFWLCIEFVIALTLSFSIPVAVLTWVLKAAGEGAQRTVATLCGAAFLTTASPIIFSKVFRELDYPWGRERARKGKSEISEGGMGGVSTGVVDSPFSVSP